MKTACYCPQDYPIRNQPLRARLERITGEMLFPASLDELIAQVLEDTDIGLVVICSQTVSFDDFSRTVFISAKRPGVKFLWCSDQFCASSSASAEWMSVTIPYHVIQVQVEEAIRLLLQASSSNSLSSLEIHWRKAVYHIPFAGIRFLERNARITWIHTSRGTFRSSEKLDDLEKRLPQSFVRCHKSYLVNSSYVHSVNLNEICLEDGQCIPVSRSRYATMLEKLKNKEE